MSVTYYVSSKLKHAHVWEGVNTLSTWIHGEKLSQPSQLSTMWERYRMEIEDCDALVMYVEDGEIYKGALLEAGMAFALEKRIYVVYAGVLPSLSAILGTWIHHPQVTIVKSISELPK